jgi:tetratricopeptide (TPR) repeat protein
LKKTKEEKAIAKETKNLSSKNDIIKKPLAEPVAKKNIKIAESIKSIKTLKGLKTIKNKVIKIIRDVNNRRVSKLDGRLKNYKFFDGRLSKLGGRLKRKILKKIKRKKTKKKNKIFAKEEIEKRTKEAKESKQFMTFSKIEISEEAIKKIENKLISEILEDSKNIEAYKKLGKVYYNQDKYHHAVECFKAALKLGSGDKKIKDLLKECEEKLNLPT